MSADVDAAREALLDVPVSGVSPFLAGAALTAAADAFEAAIRAEGLDVERLARAIADHCHEGKHEGAPIFLRHKHLAPFLVDTCGAAVAAEYARLAEAER